MARLTKAQREMLEHYDSMAHVTKETDSALKLNTWRACFRRGYLSRPLPPGSIGVEITPTGRAALKSETPSDV